MKHCFFVAAAIVTLMAGSKTFEGRLLAQEASVLSPSDPWAEFALSSSARAKATSWREKTVSNEPERAFEETTETMCPEKEHSKVIKDGAVTVEYYAIGTMVYHHDRGRWYEMPTMAPSSPSVRCGKTPPMGGSLDSLQILSQGHLPSGDIASDLLKLKKSRRDIAITRGEVSRVKGSSCQEWHIAYRNLKSERNVEFNYCVGISDHLPRRLTVDNGAQGTVETTYWDWNANISINPPADAIKVEPSSQQ